MKRILFAGFNDVAAAERTVGSLLDLGLTVEDVALVAVANGRGDANRALDEVEAGRAGSEELQRFLPRVEEEGVEGIESEIGAGIATHEPEDAVASVDEMDDGSDVAENFTDPLNERFIGEEDLLDADKFAAAGTIDETRPTGPSFADLEIPRNNQLDISTQVANGALILGDGPLATEMLVGEFTGKAHEVLDVTKGALRRLGVLPEDADELVACLRNGGAIVAGTEDPGKVWLTDIDRAMVATGGSKLAARVQRVSAHPQT